MTLKTKLINQILVLNNYAILAEALTFAEAWGIDAHKIPNALSDGHAGSNLLTHLFPRVIIHCFNVTNLFFKSNPNMYRWRFQILNENRRYC